LNTWEGIPPGASVRVHPSFSVHSGTHVWLRGCNPVGEILGDIWEYIDMLDYHLFSHPMALEQLAVLQGTSGISDLGQPRKPVRMLLNRSGLSIMGRWPQFGMTSSFEPSMLLFISRFIFIGMLKSFSPATMSVGTFILDI